MDTIGTTTSARDVLGHVPERPSWWEREHGDEPGFLAAYFCLEFGVDERLPIYSGGLGVLAGDHLKAAAELGVPLVGVGLLYRDGYFRQRLSGEGRQVEEPQPLVPGDLLARERGDDGEPLSVEVDLDGDRVDVAVWRAEVGPVTLYLLDAEGVTDALYSGDREHRIRQEFVLGVGGVRALAALGLEPTVFHMNEGHAAFLALERVRALVDDDVPAEEALARVRASIVFTTHTPVPAGNEVFGAELVRRYAAALARAAGLGEQGLLALGRDPGSDADAFGMTPMALRLSGRANAVSALHGKVAREMWAALFPDGDVPIGHVTNGIHTASWLGPELADLLDEAGVRPRAALGEQGWERVRDLDPGALWEAHAAARRRLLDGLGLDPEALTVGFARRFATYKRGGLLYRDPERLARLFDAGLQVVVAGKAHPADEGGKDVMQEIVRFARADGRGRVVFLENYDLAVARRLVQGADVWLNTPRRPLEASGTSGMKAAVNGVLNLSVLDGWWAEGYAPELGWAILGEDDEADAAELYRLLEEEVVPAFRGDRGRWIAMMKASIERAGSGFGMQRVLVEYVDGLYLPAHRS